jgi:glucan biosynthesis protein C
MAAQMARTESAHARSIAIGTRSSAGPRLLYIDNLRVLLSVLVILFHLAITYGAEGDWSYQEEGQISMAAAGTMTLFVAMCQAFFMGLFFMIAGYLGPRSYDRKGIGLYLVDRLKRLGIPLLFYQAVIKPPLSYALWVHEGHRGSYWRFLPPYLASLDSLGDGPLWFVGALLTFSVCYALWRFLARRVPTLAQNDSRVPGDAIIALFALVLGLVTYLVRIWYPVGRNLEPMHWQLAHFAQYTALYVVGTVAYRRNWFVGLGDGQGRTWLWVALALVPLFPVLLLAGGALEGDLTPLMGGVYWQSLAYSVWEQFVCVAMVVGLLVLFRNRLNHQGRLGRAMSAAAYATYVLFAPVIVLLTLALSGIRLNMALKFVLVSPVAVILCFVAGHYFRKLPLVRAIL